MALVGSHGAKADGASHGVVGATISWYDGVSLTAHLEDEFAPHVINVGERASGSKPNEHNVETQSLRVTPENQAVGSKLVCDHGNPMM
ncbi:hypothetical protein Tco_1098718 [Tanacetum coccineum]